MPGVGGCCIVAGMRPTSLPPPPVRRRRRPGRPAIMTVFAGLLVSVCASALLAAPAGALPPSVRYLALGDSYSSGQGQVLAFQGCDDEPAAWPYHVVAPGWNTTPINLVQPVDQRACSGDTASYVLDYQFPWGVPVGTDLITLTVGANDISLPVAFARCYFGDCSASLNSIDPDAALWPIERTLARARASGATVVLVTYPNLFATAQPCSGACDLTASERAAGSALMSRLNGMLRTAARRAGVHVVDAEPAFVGHEPCLNTVSPAQPCPDPWVHPAPSDLGARAALALGGGDHRTMHLNATGEQVYAELVSAFLRNWTGARTPGSLLPANPSPEPISGPLAVGPADGCRSGSTFRALDRITVRSTSVLTPGTPVNLQLSSNSGWQYKPPAMVADAAGRLDATFVLPYNLAGKSMKVEASGQSIHGTMTQLLGIVGLDPNLAPCDAVPPTASIAAPANGATVLYRSTATTVAFSCGDDRWLVACTGTQGAGAVLDATHPGNNSLAVTARDWTGNSTTATASYAVRYRIVDVAPLPAKPANVIASNTTSTLRFRITDADGLPVIAASSVKSATTRLGPCLLDQSTWKDQKAPTPAPGSDGMVWMTVAGQNAGVCGSVSVLLADGTARTWQLSWQ